MVFDRALRRELTQTAVAVFVALFAILLTTQLVRLLNEAAGGRVAAEAVVALLGFAALNYLPTVLALTLFIAVLLTLSRSYRDSEMVVWFSSGVPLTAWVRPIIRFAIPVVLAAGLISLFLTPWANYQSLQYREVMTRRGDGTPASPGVFRESASGDRVVFVEAVDDAVSQVRNVFVSSVRNGRLGVVVAAQGQQELAASGDRLLVLENGRRYEVASGSPEIQMIEFDRYRMRVETKEVRGTERTPRTMTTAELLTSSEPPAQAELLWRIGLPITAMVLSLLAIPLSFVNPRAGRSANLLFALFAFVTYLNLLSISQAWVAQARIPFALGWWLVHVVMMVALLILFLHRLRVYSIFRAWR